MTYQVIGGRMGSNEGIHITDFSAAQDGYDELKEKFGWVLKLGYSVSRLVQKGGNFLHMPALALLRGIVVEDGVARCNDSQHCSVGYTVEHAHMVQSLPAGYVYRADYNFASTITGGEDPTQKQVFCMAVLNRGQIVARPGQINLHNQLDKCATCSMLNPVNKDK